MSVSVGSRPDRARREPDPPGPPPFARAAVPAVAAAVAVVRLLAATVPVRWRDGAQEAGAPAPVPDRALRRLLGRAAPQQPASAVLRVDGRRVCVMHDGGLDGEDERALARPLRALGYGNACRSTGEILICAYARWGAAFTDRLVGDAVLVVWDERTPGRALRRTGPGARAGWVTLPGPGPRPAGHHGAMTPPRVGVVFRPQCPPERLPPVVDAAERAGVDTLWLWEDCFLAGGLTSAAVALARSERLRVGVGLLPVPLRNPALVAMEIATLSRTFPERFVPVLGHGVLDWMGQVGARVGSPLGLLGEHVDAVRALLHGETVDVVGDHVRLDRVALDHPPASPPPLLVGARGPRTLRLAGARADGVLLDTGLPPDEVRRSLSTAGGGPHFRRAGYVHATDLGADIAAGVRAYAAAGLDEVIVVPPERDPDPEPWFLVS